MNKLKKYNIINKKYVNINGKKNIKIKTYCYNLLR